MLATETTLPDRPKNLIRPDVLSWLGLVGLALLGLGVRLINLAEPSLWHDEIWSVYISKLPLAESFAVMQAGDLQPPLYYLLLRPVIALFGESHFILRLLSVVLGIMALPPLFLMARRFAGERAAWVAVVLFTFSSLNVVFSQMVRMYTLLALAVLLSYYLFWQLMTVEKPGWKLWLGYICATIAMLYSQNLAVLYLTGQGLAWLLLFRRKPLFFRAVLAWGITLLGWLPYLSTFLQQAGGNTYFPKPGFLFLLDSYLAFGAADRAHNGQPFSLLPIQQPYLFLGLGLLAWFGWRNLAARPRERLYLLIFWLVPLALCWLISQFKSVYADRAFLASAFPFLIILGAAFSTLTWPVTRPRLPRSMTVLAAGFLTAVLTLWSLGSILGGNYVHNDLRGLALDASRELRSAGDGQARVLLQFNGNSPVIFDYYSPPGTPPNRLNFSAESQAMLDSQPGRVCAITSDATELLDVPRQSFQRFKTWLASQPTQRLVWDKQYPEETLQLQCWEYRR
ncbi:MAG: hypothetical protein JWP00_4735 [Chloroflexi bacterium]|nr:hypothetical protein [Chloroflexota bacterium]